jgi:hypothetical protein
VKEGCLLVLRENRREERGPGLTWMGPLHSKGKGVVCYKVVASRAGVCDENVAGY